MAVALCCVLPAARGTAAAGTASVASRAAGTTRPPASGNRSAPPGAWTDEVFPHPLDLAQCRDRLGTSCYTPHQLRTAYGLDQAAAKRLTGKGVTIVTGIGVIPPTLQHDVNVFSDRFRLPRTRLEFAFEEGASPFDPHDHAAHREAILDVSALHAMAPRAKIVVVGVPVIPGDLAATLPEGYIKAIEQDAGDVLSMSWNDFEQHLQQINPRISQGSPALAHLRRPLVEAAARGITMVASSGDYGGLAPSAGALWPAADPLVTSVGGTDLDLDQYGHRRRPDIAWDASTGGLSQWFPRPTYQKPVTNIVDGRRGEPDVSMSAGPFWVYDSADPQQAGWQLAGGTSLSSPLFAGIAALADEAAGHRLGPLNPTLYRNVHDLKRAGLVDVTAGRSDRNAHPDRPAPPEPPGWRGYPALPGYDLVTGLGTVRHSSRLICTLSRGAMRPPCDLTHPGG
ncbi:S53 family peptidase (plasmid) [Streptomyces sp. CA-142005]|uniref:S53 family peptidase n=1 Tax=Streptomyces sp. CA-142005 TaxID=3240052 RepID=UPI003D8A8903